MHDTLDREPRSRSSGSSWLEVNREAERSGDWRIMADWYAEDATYGWMYTPDEHFMAVGRDQIRDCAIGIEMDGLDGWHYDYQATMIDEQNGMVRRLLEAAVRDHRRRDRPGVRDPRHRRLVVRRRAPGRRADDGLQVRLAARLVRHAARPRTRSWRSSRPARRPSTLLERMARRRPRRARATTSYERPALDASGRRRSSAGTTSPRSRPE